VLLVTLAGLIGKWALEQKKKEFFAYFAAMTLLVIISNIYLNTDFQYSASFVRVYNAEGMGTGYIAGSEYLPYGADPDKFFHRDPIAEDGLLVENYEKSGLTIDVTCTNAGSDSASVHMPLLYYKGYVTYDRDTKESFETYADEDFLVAVSVPAGYSGQLRTCFRSPWYWRVAEAVTVLFFVGLVVENYVRKRGGKVCAK